ncbi:MAG: hypothetical protein D6768_20230 [Chloroflexi bacterium]|nr:MAG: hypothetical protein D6768_20230 [Chloroflexota bacterium]
MLHQLTQTLQTIRFAPPKHRVLWLPLALVALAGIVLVGLVFVVLLFQLAYLQRVYPGVTLAGADVSSMTRADVVSMVNTLAYEQLNRPITLRTEDEQWTFTGQELGMSVDTVATADRVFAVGRSGSLLTDLPAQVSLLWHPQNIEPVFRYDTGPTNQVLNELSRVIDIPPQNAGLQVNPNGTVDLLLARHGRRLHVGATQPLIEAAVTGESAPDVTVFTQEILPAIDTADLADLQQQARRLVQQPFIFDYPDAQSPARWHIAPEDMAPMIHVEETTQANGNPKFALALDQEMLTPFLETITQAINRDPVDAVVRFDEEAGQLVALQPSTSGRQLDVAQTRQLVADAVHNGQNKITLPVEQISPKIDSDNLDSLGITALVSEATSYFKGSSAGRMKNIALAASKFDGVLVPPGEIFSFNQHLGPVTKEEGYDESLIIFGDRTTVGIGGGVCQVSTTAFRTAFFGGFELVERWAHGYRVGWYETNSVPGLDATIYTPDVDFKFRNDTEHYLLIQTSTNLDDGTVTFKFFGTPTNREVIVSDPVIENVVKPPPPLYEQVPGLPKGTVKQVDWAKEGMDVTVTRVVKQGESILYSDEIVSRYRPWRAVYQVAAAPSPRATVAPALPAPPAPVR